MACYPFYSFVSLGSAFSLRRGIPFTCLCLLLLISCQEKNPEIPPPPSFKTPLGKVFSREEPSGKSLQNYLDAKAAFEKDTSSTDLLIWYGRRMAYLGNYEDAISIYTVGIRRFPDDARLYRHRGHRYISIREFDKAIADLQKAASLIRGTENETEPDGIPNAMNIPVSTLHGNIWYHLGLAHYLKGDYDKAYSAYLNCLKSGSNPDNLVSSTHWLYMIQRRLGNRERADSLLKPITADLQVIENTNYYELCKFYKGLMEQEDLLSSEGSSAASDATAYGLANWFLCEGQRSKGKALLEDLVDRNTWSSFGYIAAESDLMRYDSIFPIAK